MRKKCGAHKSWVRGNLMIPIYLNLHPRTEDRAWAWAKKYTTVVLVMRGEGGRWDGKYVLAHKFTFKSRAHYDEIPYGW